MEGNRFDDLTRAIAGSATRRGVLRRLAGAVAGGLLVAVGVRQAEATPCRPDGRPCRLHAECCSGTCDFNVHPNRRKPPHGHCGAATTTTTTTSGPTTTSTTPNVT